MDLPNMWLLEFPGDRRLGSSAQGSGFAKRDVSRCVHKTAVSADRDQ